MGFLLAKILLLVIVAAFLGGMLARWYVRRNMRDVTGEYTQMRVDWQTWRQSIEKLLAQRPQPDFAPLQTHFEKIESAIRAIPAPAATDLNPLMRAIAAIPAPPAIELRPILEPLGDIERSIKSIVIPQPEAVDLSAVQSRLDGMERAISSISMPVPKEVDLSEVLDRLSTLEQRVHGIIIPPATQVDLQPILQRLSELDAHIQNAEAVRLDEPRLVPVSMEVSKAVNSPSVRAGSRNLLSHAGFGEADNLQRMRGVKRVMEKMLHDIGVYYFWQIAEWTSADILHADAQLTEFHGRIQRDGWVAQAIELARAPDAAVKPATIGAAQAERSLSQPTESGQAAI